MPNTPRDLTVLTLTHATGAQLKYWIDGANREAGKRQLTKVGRVDELRQKLASHYDLDLSTPPSALAPAGPATRDVDIQKRQWSHLRQLGEAWKEAPDSFRLCEGQGMCQNSAGRTVLTFFFFFSCSITSIPSSRAPNNACIINDSSAGRHFGHVVTKQSSSPRNRARTSGDGACLAAGCKGWQY